MNFQPAERAHQTQQFKQNEKAEKYSAGEGTWFKKPPNQTKEEEIGSLPEKEFRMTVKMIQNLENKMELWKNRIETRVEKIEKMFNKHLEGKKKSQSIIHNAITEI